MPAGRVLQSALSAGEFSVRARDRSDLQAYFQGAEIVENLFCLIEGPAFRRGGFELIGEVKFADKKTLLVPFSRSTETTVAIEVGDLYMRLFDGDSGAPLTSGGPIIELITPYAEANVDALYWSQSADVMWFCERSSDFQVQILKRFSDTTWVLDPYVIKEGPLLTENFGAITITPSAVTGPTTLTASAAIFDANVVGGLYRLYTDGRGIPHKKWEAGETLVALELREHAGRIYQAAIGGDASNSPPVHDTGQVSDGGVISWTYLNDLAGIVRITGYTSPTVVTGTVERRLPSLLATKSWAQGAFSDETGHPKLVGIVDQRLFFCSTKQQPDTMFLSRINGFNDVDVDFQVSDGNGEVFDDHAITRTLADNEINSPGWAVNDEQLILGTARGLIRITGPSPDEGLSPAGAQARKIRGSKPSSLRCPGIHADGALVYASIGGAKLYEYDEKDAHLDLMGRAEHVGASEIIRIVWCGEPYQRLFALRADGKLFCLTLDRNQQVRAWSRMSIGGSYNGGPPFVESITKLKDARGFERLWAVIKRTINGADKKTIERLVLDWRLERDLPDTANYMDGSVVVDLWNADPAKTITITAAAGAAFGDAAALAAIGHTPFTGMENEIVALRIVTPSTEPGAAPIIKLCQVQIDTVNSSTSIDGIFIIGPDEPDALLNAPLADWAFTSTTIPGLGHLEGETVIIQADGMEYGEAVVAAGVATLTENYARAVAGLPVAWRARSLPIALRMPDGASKGRKMTAEEAFVTLSEAGPEQASVRVIEDKTPRAGTVMSGRDADDDLGGPPRMKSYTEAVKLKARAGVDIQLEIFGAGALPVTLQSFLLEYSSE